MGQETPASYGRSNSMVRARQEIQAMVDTRNRDTAGGDNSDQLRLQGRQRILPLQVKQELGATWWRRAICGARFE